MAAPTHHLAANVIDAMYADFHHCARKLCIQLLVGLRERKASRVKRVPMEDHCFALTTYREIKRRTGYTWLISPDDKLGH